MTNNENLLKNKDLLPTLDSNRNMSLLDYTLLWAGMTIDIVAFSLGSQYYNNGHGLSPWSMVLAMFLGYGIVTIFTVMIGDIGTKYGISFSLYSRAAFGYKGSYIAGIIRVIPAIYWFGFLTWVGASSLNHIFAMIFPGFNNLTIMIILFAIVQIFNSIYGLKAMAKFDWLAIPLLAILFGAILINTLIKYDISISDIMSTQTEGNFSLAFAIAGIAGGWITMALNGCDLTRQIKHRKNFQHMNFLSRNRNAIIGQIVGLMFVGILTMLIGAASGITSGYWDLNEVIPNLFNSNFSLLFCFLAVVLAQWSTNTTANLLPPTLVLLNIFPKLKFSVSATICGLIGVLIIPLQAQGSTFLVFVQYWISQMLGPVIGILLADYFIIRKCKVNIHDLFMLDGQYQYFKGFNPAAISTIIISFLLGLPCGDYAFFVGLFCSIVLYSILMKFIILTKFEQNIGKEKFLMQKLNDSSNITEQKPIVLNKNII